MLAAEWRQGAHGLRGARAIIGGLRQEGRLLGLWGVWLCRWGHGLPHACGDKEAASGPAHPPPRRPHHPSWSRQDGARAVGWVALRLDRAECRAAAVSRAGETPSLEPEPWDA